MEKQSKTPLADIKYEEISKAIKKLKDAGILFSGSMMQISKAFLIQLLDVNPYKCSFEELRTEYIVSSGDEETEVPSTESAFHDFIAKRYLDLEVEPRSELLDQYESTVSHLREIDDNLFNIKKQLDEITKRNNPSEIQEKKPILYYYEEHNLLAKEELMQFLKEDIKHFALGKCYDRHWSSWAHYGIPYSYSFNREGYKPKEPDDLVNKFGALPYDEFKNLHRLYKTDKPLFYIYLANHIRDHEIVFCIGELLDDNHVLHPKKELIREALSIYSSGNKIMFANAIPTIIEGILHDLCLEVGVPERDLLTEGFQYKLNKLNPILGLDLHYEYYSFRFRLFRNKVAHGRLTKADSDELADLLLLDLFDACKIPRSMKLKVNQKRFVTEELNKEIAKPNWNDLIQYIFLENVAIPEFYHLDDKIARVEGLITEQLFWDYLEKLLADPDEETAHGLFKLQKILSRRKPHDNRCIKIKKLTGVDKLDSILADKYIRNMTSYY